MDPFTLHDRQEQGLGEPGSSHMICRQLTAARVGLTHKAVKGSPGERQQRCSSLPVARACPVANSMNGLVYGAGLFLVSSEQKFAVSPEKVHLTDDQERKMLINQT